MLFNTFVYKDWDYLLLDVNKQCPDLTKLTRSFEIYKFIEIFKYKLNDDLTLSDALNNMTSARKPKNSDKDTKSVLINDFTKSVTLFHDCNMVPGVIVKSEGSEFVYIYLFIYLYHKQNSLN